MALGHPKSLPAMIGDNWCYDSSCPHCSSRPDSTPETFLFSRQDRKTRKERRAERISTPDKIEAWRKFCRSGPAKTSTPTLSSHQPLRHNHGNLTSDAAAGLLAVIDQGFNGQPTTDRMPIHFNGLLATPEARPSPSKPPRTVPVTNTRSLPTWQRYATQC